MGTINQIAAELGVDIETAENFVTKVRQIRGMPIKYTIILDVLTHFEDPKQATPELVVSLTQLSQIAASLNLPINSTREFVTKVEQLVGTPLNYEVILHALKYIKYQKTTSPETVASLIQAAPVIASILKVDINAAKDFIGEIWELAETPVRPETILDILKLIKDSMPITPEAVASLVQIASKLDVDLPTATNFVTKIGQLTKKQYKHPVIAFVLKRMKRPEQATPELVACLLQIATVLSVDINIAEDFISEVQQLIEIPLKYRIISIVLSQLKDPKQITPSLLVSSIFEFLQIAVVLKTNVKNVESFVVEVRQFARISVEYKQILNILRRFENPTQVSPQTVASLIPVPKSSNIAKEEQKTTQKPQVQTTKPKEDDRLSERDTLFDIAQELRVGIKATKSFLSDVQRLCGKNIEQDEILVAITQLKHRKQIVSLESLAFELSFSKIQIVTTEEFETDARKIVQTLFTDLGLQLIIDQSKLVAKDSSAYYLPSDLINGLVKGPTYIQGVVNQITTQANFGELVSLVVLLNLPEKGFESQLPPQQVQLILNTIAINIVKNTSLLIRLLQQLVAYRHHQTWIYQFNYQVLLNLYFRANLVRDKSYIAHFDDSNHVVFKVLPSQNLTTFYTFATHSIWSLLWKLSPLSLSHLSPNLVQGEIWLSTKIPTTLQTTLHDRQTNSQALIDYGQMCFDELKNRRRYQIPSQGRAEIIVSERLKNLLGLNLIRFVQEDIDPPGVFLRFEFGFEQPTVGLAKIEKDGRVEGFHDFFSLDDSFKVLIDAIALAYYRDLVIPGKIYFYHRGSRGSSRQTPRPPLPPRPNPLPRPQGIPIGNKYHRFINRQAFPLNAWHEAQERARHGVIGHTRWIGEGFIADIEKQQEAWEAAHIKLQPGYTWVVEHERGGVGSGNLYLSHTGHLLERTLFLPPERASAELDKLLS